MKTKTMEVNENENKKNGGKTCTLRFHLNYK